MGRALAHPTPRQFIPDTPARHQSKGDSNQADMGLSVLSKRLFDSIHALLPFRETHRQEVVDVHAHVNTLEVRSKIPVAMAEKVPATAKGSVPSPLCIVRQHNLLSPDIHPDAGLNPCGLLPDQRAPSSPSAAFMTVWKRTWASLPKRGSRVGPAREAAGEDSPHRKRAIWRGEASAGCASAIRDAIVSRPAEDNATPLSGGIGGIGSPRHRSQ